MVKLGVIYGGISTEHDVSEMSAKSVIENLDKENTIITNQIPRSGLTVYNKSCVYLEY